MEKINGMVCWYQQKVGTYDKQLWERSVEKTVIKNIEHVPRKLTKVKTDLIDVDLVRGSTFPKAKPKHGWWLLSWRGLLRVLFLPLYLKWWRQQSSIWFSVLLLFLYVSQVGTLILYCTDTGTNVSAETLSLAHLVTPVILVLILGFIHSQIVATQSLHKHKRPITPERRTGTVKKKHKNSKSSRSSKSPVAAAAAGLVVDDYTSGHADTEEAETMTKRKRRIVRKKSGSVLNDEYTGALADRSGLRLHDIDRSTSVDSSNVCTEEEEQLPTRCPSYKQLDATAAGRRLARKVRKYALNAATTTAACDITTTSETPSNGAMTNWDTTDIETSVNYSCINELGNIPTTGTSHGVETKRDHHVTGSDHIRKISDCCHESNDGGPCISSVCKQLVNRQNSEEEEELIMTQQKKEDNTVVLQNAMAKLTDSCNGSSTLRYRGHRQSNDGICSSVIGQKSSISKKCDNKPQKDGGVFQNDDDTDRLFSDGHVINTLCYKNATFLDDEDVLDSPNVEDLSVPLTSFEGEMLAPTTEDGFKLGNGVVVSCDTQECSSSVNTVMYDHDKESCSSQNNEKSSLYSRCSKGSPPAEKSALNATGTSEERRASSDFENIVVVGGNEEMERSGVVLSVHSDTGKEFDSKRANTLDLGRKSQKLDGDIQGDWVKGKEIDRNLDQVNHLPARDRVDDSSRDSVPMNGDLNSSSGTFIPGEAEHWEEMEELGGGVVGGVARTAVCYHGHKGVGAEMESTEGEEMESVVGTIEEIVGATGKHSQVKTRKLPLEIKRVTRPADPTVCSVKRPDKTRDDLFLLDSGSKLEDLLDDCTRTTGRTRLASVPVSGIRGPKDSSGNSSCESDGETTPNVPTPKKDLRKRSMGVVADGCASTDGQTSEMEWDANSGDMTTDTSSQVTTETELSGREEEGRDSDGYGWSENLHHANSVMNNLASSTDKVSCIIWEGEEVKKVDLTVLDLGWTIIQKADKIPEKSDYVTLGLLFSVVLMCLPALYRFHHLRERLDSLHTMGNITGCLHVVKMLLGDNWVEQVVIVNGLLQRLCVALVFFFLLSVAERTFKQRLLYAKHFCYLTSCRRAKKYDMPHFRMNKVRNIKTWLSLRSYLKRRGPQRSVNTIVSSAFILEVTFLSLMCVELLHDSGGFLDHLGNWEVVMWCLAMGIYLLRFMTLGTQINKKYRNFSVLITEQINLYLHMERKPHKKEELTLANNVLKLAEALLKELESPFKISGLSVNPFLYNTFKVVILSAFSAVLTELLGFKLKLYKIKLKA